MERNIINRNYKDSLKRGVLYSLEQLEVNERG